MKKTRRRKFEQSAPAMSAVRPVRLATVPPSVDELRRRHAERFAGGSLDRVHTVQFELDWIRHNGALVDVDLDGLSMLAGTVSLKELGFPGEIALAAIGQVIMNLADAGLLPDWIMAFNRRSNSVTMSLCNPIHLRRAKSVESATRQALGRHSYRRGLEKVIGNYAWVPATAYSEWKADFEQRQAELAEVRADIVRDVPGYVHDVAAGWRLIAREAYAAIVKRQPGFGYTEAEFTERLVESATERLPTAADVANGIHLDYVTPLLLAPSEVESELAQRDAIAHRREVEAAQASAAAAEERAHARVVENEAFAHAQVIQAEAEAQVRVARDRAEFERRRLEVMHEAELEHARQQIAQMTSPFQQVLESLRSDVYDTVQQVLESIQKHGHIRGKTAEQVENLVSNFRLLNVAGDAELERLLQQLTAAMRQPGADSTHDTAAVSNALQKIADTTAEAARNVAHRLEVSQASMILV